MPYFSRWNPKKKCWEATPELVALMYPVYGDILWDFPLFSNPPKQHGNKHQQLWNKHHLSKQPKSSSQPSQNGATSTSEQSELPF